MRSEENNDLDPIHCAYNGQNRVCRRTIIVYVLLSTTQCFY